MYNAPTCDISQATAQNYNPTTTFHDTSPGFEVDEYTRLGLDGPSIRIKKFTGMTAPSQGSSYLFRHNLDATKILSINARVEIHNNVYIPPGYTIQANSEYSFFWNSLNIFISNKLGNSSAILNKPFTITVIYEK